MNWGLLCPVSREAAGGFTSSFAPNGTLNDQDEALPEARIAVAEGAFHPFVRQMAIILKRMQSQL